MHTSVHTWQAAGILNNVLFSSDVMVSLPVAMHVAAHAQETAEADATWVCRIAEYEAAAASTLTALRAAHEAELLNLQRDAQALMRCSEKVACTTAIIGCICWRLQRLPKRHPSTSACVPFPAHMCYMCSFPRAGWPS